MAEALLSVRRLKKHYRRGGAWLEALRGVDLDLAAGEALAIVGASGSGKSTLARCILAVERPDSGSICFAGREWGQERGRALIDLWRQAQFVFQSPHASFDPRWTVGKSLAEPLLHLRPELGAGARREEVARLLELVELDVGHGGRYPCELSGGQLQRVAIARALAPRPALLVADECTSALDTVTQQQILRLVNSLRKSQELSLLWITHDLFVVPHICQRCAVMDEGRVVETLAADALSRAEHPITRALRDAADIQGVEV